VKSQRLSYEQLRRNHPEWTIYTNRIQNVKHFIAIQFKNGNLRKLEDLEVSGLDEQIKNTDCMAIEEME